MADLSLVAPGADTIVRAALERAKPGMRVLLLGGQGHLTALFENMVGAGLVFDEKSGDALGSVESFGLVVVFQPSRLGPLVQVMQDFCEALAPDGHAVVGDVVWQTAPTPELAQAFAPAPGRERVRPVEGYEMQLEHAGFDVVERLSFGRDEWLAHFAHHPAAVAQRQAVEGDERGALRFAAWVLKPAAE